MSDFEHIKSFLPSIPPWGWSIIAFVFLCGSMVCEIFQPREPRRAFGEDECERKKKDLEYEEDHNRERIYKIIKVSIIGLLLIGVNLCYYLS